LWETVKIAVENFSFDERGREPERRGAKQRAA
jgi:hypothetical protein